MVNGSDLHKLIDEIDEIADQGARIPLVEDAIRLADQLQERYFSFSLRMDLIHHAVFNGQAMKSLPAFAWCLADLERPDCEFELDDILWEYKWINSGSADFSEISMQKIEELDLDFKQKLQECGYNENCYHYVRMNRGIAIHDKALAEASFIEMGKYPRDIMSDCRACVQDGLVEFMLFMGRYQEAKKLAEPIFQGKLSCAEVPHYTYGKMLLPTYFAGELEEAAAIEKKAYRLLYKNEEFLGLIGDFLLYYAFTAPKKALERYPKFATWPYNPYTTGLRKRSFHASVAAMFAQLIKIGKEDTSFQLAKGHPLYDTSGVYSLKALQDYHYAAAAEIGDKFDARNGNSGYANELAETMARVS
ncbi:MAG: hypothetical protein LBV04_09005 [Deferribacteraceae bacterium]|jgi:hypothetical protein|nr:hypothetical protein [Deferribacteraceae bacterium]